MIAEGTKLRQLHTRIFSGTDLVLLNAEVDAFLEAQEEAVLQDWKICSLAQEDVIVEKDDPDVDLAQGQAAALCIVIFYVTG